MGTVLGFIVDHIFTLVIMHVLGCRYTVMRQAAVFLQAAWRGHAARSHVQKQHAAATHMQAAWRGHAAQLAFQRMRAAAVCIQARARGMLARRAYAAQIHAVAIIQASTRMEPCGGFSWHLYASHAMKRAVDRSGKPSCTCYCWHGIRLAVFL